MYTKSKPADSSEFKKIKGCVKDIKDWMSQNFLQLHPEKTKAHLLDLYINYIEKNI